MPWRLATAIRWWHSNTKKGFIPKTISVSQPQRSTRFQMKCSLEPAFAIKVGRVLRERLRSADLMADSTFQLDASIGVACFPQDGTDLDSLLGTPISDV